MALEKGRKRKKRGDMFFAPTQQQEETSGSEWSAWLEHIRENPLLYIAAVVFILIAAMAGVLYRVNVHAQQAQVVSEYARVMQTEDPAVRATELQQLASEARGLREEILYMAAESAFDAGEYEQAGELFQELRQEYPEGEFTPFAVEALGNLAEEDENYEEALRLYEEVVELWPETLPGKRAYYAMGRVHEEQDAIEEAIAAYEEQIAIFPGSNQARKARTALTRLDVEHPEEVPDDLVEDAPLEDDMDPTPPTAGDQPMMAPPAGAQSGDAPPPAPPVDGAPTAPPEAPDAPPMDVQPAPEGEVEIDPEAETPEMPEFPA
ncbi:MAG: tetratricopeptide repeat protein, partial [Candidatus Hydrogenedentota bacterium]